MDSAKDQAELREAPRPREGSFRVKLSLPLRQSAHGMTSATPSPSSCIKQSIKLHQAKEASGLAIFRDKESACTTDVTVGGPTDLCSANHRPGWTVAFQH